MFIIKHTDMYTLNFLHHRKNTMEENGEQEGTFYKKRRQQNCELLCGYTIPNFPHKTFSLLAFENSKWQKRWYKGRESPCNS